MREFFKNANPLHHKQKLAVDAKFASKGAKEFCRFLLNEIFSGFSAFKGLGPDCGIKTFIFGQKNCLFNSNFFLKSAIFLFHGFTVVASLLKIFSLDFSLKINF